jgi:putative ABC transport system permease protein
LKDSATLETARVEMQGITEGLEREYPKSNSGIRATLRPLREVWLGPIGPILWALFGAVVFVLIIASVNIANLQLSRALRREREIAIRSALGAGRGRLLRQLGAESLLLAMLGGGAGLLLGWRTLPWLASSLQDAPRIEGVRLDMPVLAYTLLVALLTTLLFGLLPALELTRTGASDALKGAGRTSTSGRLSRKFRSGFAISEIALSSVLLIGAGLMIHTMYALTHVQAGFEPKNVLTLRFDLAGPGFEDGQKLRAFYTSFLDQIHKLPGITSAAVTVSLPIDGSQWDSVFVVEDQPVPPRAELPSAAFIPASEDYFHTMGTRLLRGRTFSSADTHESRRVCVINETMARRFWPGADPIGKRIKQGWPEWATPMQEVVGVVEDAKLNGVQAATPLEIFMPLWQETPWSAYLVVKSNLERGPILKEIDQTFRSLAPDVARYSVRSMDEVLDQGVARQRSTELLLAVFAGLALALSVIGIYGVVAHGVGQRTQEIGIRMALGASPASVFRMVAGQGLRMLAAGLALGAGGAFLLARILASLLFDVSPTDPATLAWVAALLSAAVFLACYIPARRATKVDPTVALRHE